MGNYVITSCSTMDITAEQARENELDFLKFNYTLDDVSYFDDMFESSTPKAFYDAMVNGASTRTSQVNVEVYYDLFKKYLSEGKDVLHIAFSSGLSGSYNSAKIAAADIKEEFPDRKLIVIDSLAASSGFGLLVMKAVELKKEGKSIDEVAEWVLANRTRVHHWFTATDLTFFVKGGRVSKVAGWFGTMLKICPLLNVDYQGKLIPREKKRGKENALKSLVEKMEQNAEGGLEYNDLCYICNSDVYDDALFVKNLVEERFVNLKGKVQIYNIGPTIGSHTGPGTVALFFMGKERID